MESSRVYAASRRIEQQDIDGWADMAGYCRGVLRSRFYMEDDRGGSLFFTAGAMLEDQSGGTIGAAMVPDGNRFPEELTTQRHHAGVVGRFLAGTKVVSLRGSGHGALQPTSVGVCQMLN